MCSKQELDLKVENVDYEMVKKSFERIIDDGSSLIGDVWNDDMTEYKNEYSDEELNNFLEQIGGEKIFWKKNI